MGHGVRGIIESLFQVALFVLPIAGCAVTPLREYPPTADLVEPPQLPIPVQGEAMETVTFGRTLVDIPVGATVGRIVLDGRVVDHVTLKEADLSAGPPAWSRMGLTEL